MCPTNNKTQKICWELLFYIAVAQCRCQLALAGNIYLWHIFPTFLAHTSHEHTTSTTMRQHRAAWGGGQETIFMNSLLKIHNNI